MEVICLRVTWPMGRGVRPSYTHPPPTRPLGVWRGNMNQGLKGKSLRLYLGSGK